MAKEQILYQKTAGLNTLSSPESLGWTPEGVCELAQCLNCFITPNGKLERAFEQSVIVEAPGAVHTLYEKERRFYGVGTNLYELVNGVSLLVKGDCSGNPIVISVYGGMAFCFDGISFFTVMADRRVIPWQFVEKKGAKSTRPFYGPIAHTKSAVGWGRLFLLNAGLLFYSEPVGPTMFDYSTSVVVDANPIQDFAMIQGLAVIGTSKTTFSLVGADFNQKVRNLLFSEPIIPNTLASGVTSDGKQLICFAVADGIYGVGADGNLLELTQGKAGKEFFNKTFVGASIVDGRYTVYGEDSFSINFDTKSLEQHDSAVTKVSGSLVYDGKVKAVTQTTRKASGVSEVTFPSISFNTLLKKSLRYLLVGGVFAQESTWIVSDERGRTSTKVMPAGKFLKVPVSSVVSGQYITVKFSTAGDFKLDTVHVIPVLKVVKH